MYKAILATVVSLEGFLYFFPVSSLLTDSLNIAKHFLISVC
jgi:hypothetical protein